MNELPTLANRCVLPGWSPGHAVTAEGLGLDMSLIPEDGPRTLVHAREPLVGWSEVDGRGLTRWRHATVLALAETTSTNAVGLLLASCGALDGTTIVAGRQTHGRGRGGRLWDSPTGGGLYYSVVLSSLGGAMAAWLPLLGALSWAHLLEGCGLAPQLKWPNDLLLDGQKIGGFLAEGSRGSFVLGIGVNVRTTSSRDTGLDRHAARLDEYLDPVPTMPDMFLRAFAHLEVLVQRLEDHGEEALVAELRARCVTLGADVRYLFEGHEVRAHALDLDPHGGLIVERDTGARDTIYAGDVHLVRP